MVSGWVSICSLSCCWARPPREVPVFEFLDKGLEACLCGFLAILLKASDDQEFFGRSEFLGLLGEERCEGQDAQGEREREPS
jgi:hypothetical protein